MDAYASVNDSTRRKMEEMLKTWKEPVPGSIDKNPVFPADSVRPIETALIKARTSALQAQQEQMRSQHQLLARGGRPQAPYRATPTPPNARQPFNQPPYPGVNNNRQDPSLGGQQAYHQQQPQQQQQVRRSNLLIAKLILTCSLSPDCVVPWVDRSTTLFGASRCSFSTSSRVLWCTSCSGRTRHGFIK